MSEINFNEAILQLLDRRVFATPVEIACLIFSRFTVKQTPYKGFYGVQVTYVTSEGYNKKHFYRGHLSELLKEAVYG